jgi:hypothetical protein
VTLHLLSPSGLLRKTFKMPLLVEPADGDPVGRRVRPAQVAIPATLLLNLPLTKRDKFGTFNASNPTHLITFLHSPSVAGLYFPSI